MLTLSYEFKLKPTCRQTQTMESWWEICRQVGNDGLRERKHEVKSRKSPVNTCRLGGEYIIPADTPRPTYASQCKALTPAKKDHPQPKIPNRKSGSKCFGVAQHKRSNLWRPHGWTWIDRDLVFLVLRKKGDFTPLFFPK
jgi:putative transposase